MIKWILFLTSIFSSALIAKPFTVVIDPGHGGSDQGATKGKHREAFITMKVSDHLYNFLRNDSRFTPVLTRKKNHNLELRDRALIAQKVRGDVFVSIHVNASPDSRAKGAQVYFESQLPPSEESLFLAHFENNSHGESVDSRAVYDIIPQQDKLDKEVVSIIQDLRRNSRIRISSELAKIIIKDFRSWSKVNRNAIRQAPFFVTKNVNMPSVLVELGFLTNPRDARQLKSSSFQRRMAKSIHNSLIKFKEAMDKSHN